MANGMQGKAGAQEAGVVKGEVRGMQGVTGAQDGGVGETARDVGAAVKDGKEVAGEKEVAEAVVGATEVKAVGLTEGAMERGK